MHKARNARARRLLAVSVLIGSTMLIAATPAGAAPSRGGCPPGNGTKFQLTTASEWQAMSEAGIVKVFGSMEAGAELLLGSGATAADLSLAIAQTFGYIDAIAPGIVGDGWICVSSTNPPGQPDYLFNVANNKFNG